LLAARFKRNFKHNVQILLYSGKFIYSCLTVYSARIGNEDTINHLYEVLPFTAVVTRMCTVDVQFASLLVRCCCWMLQFFL